MVRPSGPKSLPADDSVVLAQNQLTCGLANRGALGRPAAVPRAVEVEGENAVRWPDDHCPALHSQQFRWLDAAVSRASPGSAGHGAGARSSATSATTTACSAATPCRRCSGPAPPPTATSTATT